MEVKWVSFVIHNMPLSTLDLRLMGDLGRGLVAMGTNPHYKLEIFSPAS